MSFVSLPKDRDGRYRGAKDTVWTIPSEPLQHTGQFIYPSYLLVGLLDVVFQITRESPVRPLHLRSKHEESQRNGLVRLRLPVVLDR